jgi:uncharacterized membrane protein
VSLREIGQRFIDAIAMPASQQVDGEAPIAACGHGGHDECLSIGMAIEKETTMNAIANPVSSGAARATGSIYLLLLPIPVICFIGAVLTDIAYSSGAMLMWLHFSEWLIAAGLVFGALAALALVVEFFMSDVIRRGAFGWVHLVLLIAALVIELFDALVHTIDGWTAVVPTGMTLSVIGALLALATVATLWRVPLVWMAPREVRP